MYFKYPNHSFLDLVQFSEPQALVSSHSTSRNSEIAVFYLRLQSWPFDVHPVSNRLPTSQSSIKSDDRVYIFPTLRDIRRDSPNIINHERYTAIIPFSSIDQVYRVCYKNLIYKGPSNMPIQIYCVVYLNASNTFTNKHMANSYNTRENIKIHHYSF